MSGRKVLVVSPKGLDTSALCEQLIAAGWEVVIAPGLAAARQMLAGQSIPVGFLVLTEVDAALCSQLRRFLKDHSQLEWVAGFEANALQLDDSRDLILEYLFDHLTLPVGVQHLTATLGHALGRANLRHSPSPEAPQEANTPIIGRTPAVVRLLRQVRRVARVDAPALICGESGSGKELVANAIHNLSQRAGGPFVVVNCGAIPATLIQSELFGHEKGSFTGADRQRRGLIEAANGGTLFLDEIGDLPLALQTNLLRFLQESTIDRIGATKGIRVDVRVIAATNVDLEGAVASGAFRKDLYYRLNVLPLSVPPLRERADDIPLLAEHFFDKFREDRANVLKGFSRRATSAMLAHKWPGNVRELVNRIRRAMVLAEGRLIQPGDLGLDEVESAPLDLPLDEARMLAERHAIWESLQSSGQNVSFAAKRLRVSRMTLYRLMAKHRISS